MKPYQRAIAIVNVILFLFFWWLSWIGHSHLPGQLGSEMRSDVMLSKYQLVCARLTAALTASCLVVIVLVNAVLIAGYFLLRKSMSSTAGSDESTPEAS